MAGLIEFYFDFSSPYSYLAAEKIDALAARFGREVDWRPILLGAVFQHLNTVSLVKQPSQSEYAIRDMARSARHMGIPFTFPSRFPLPTQAAARAFYWIVEQDVALAKAFAHAVFRAFYVDDEDISAPALVLDIAAGLGVERAALEAGIASPEIKQRLKQETEDSIAKGLFGAPWMIVDGEAFWGADRLPQIEQWLETGGF
ncbi:MAG: 2-hydroxychromene-2-carboxylate isomerase [Rhodocyclaceae bacterium]|nr:2-hydroxychromene-2-carboxylate isomerase [Rhodocyclaceae bacterium]